MSNDLIINASLPETRIALMENGEIQELLIERASGKGIVGNIYKGRVTRVLPGMQAAFVDIGLEKAAFLYVDDVFVHSEVWEKEEAAPAGAELSPSESPGESGEGESPASTSSAIEALNNLAAGAGETPVNPSSDEFADDQPGDPADDVDDDEGDLDDLDENEDPGEDDEDDEDDDHDHGPVEMGAEGSDGDGSSPPEGTVAPPASTEGTTGSSKSGEGSEASSSQQDDSQAKRRHRRGRRGGRYRRRDKGGAEGDETISSATSPIQASRGSENIPEGMQSQMREPGAQDSDRTSISGTGEAHSGEPFAGSHEQGRPEIQNSVHLEGESTAGRMPSVDRQDFKQPRSRDRRIRTKTSSRPPRVQVNIQDLLKEGQEVLVQVAKDPISTKGARLTCHISLPGRHLVCMPTIDHVGVSRRIERDDERRRLREFVDRNRPRNLGFIVRTASGKQHEKRIKQDIEYLTRLWTEIREKSAAVTAPALVYEDLNAVLRAIRDWVTEEIDKIIVDSRYHYNDILRFVSDFMPSLKQKVELYHGDIPIFDAYNISTELSRALERKVWLKSGGYLVIDQAEALVAIDVNTGRYVGKKNLEDTILKTNLEAVVEIAYQLRLRNCGGIIILDLIDMEKDENKQRVYRALEEALKKDRARPSILKISELGLVEMTRKRTRDTMVRTLCEPCPHCEGKGFIKGKVTVAYEVLREIEREGIERDVGKIMVQGHPDVIDILAIDERDTLDQLERRYRKQVYLQAVTDFHLEQFEVVGDKGPQVGDRPREITAQTMREGREGRDSRDSRDNREGGRDRGSRDRGGRDRGGRDQRDRDSRDNRDRDNRDRPAGTPRVIPVAQPVQIPVPQIHSTGEPGSIQTSADLVMTGPVAGPLDSSISGHMAGPMSGMDEEDRLAYLRAQAAQDAALAKLGISTHPAGANGQGPSPVRPGVVGRPMRDKRDNRDNGPESRDAKGRRRRRGRRGGKFKRDDGAGPRPQLQGGQSGGPGIIQPVIRPVIQAANPAPSSGSEGSSGGGGGGGNGGGSSSESSDGGGGQ